MLGSWHVGMLLQVGLEVEAILQLPEALVSKGK